MTTRRDLKEVQISCFLSQATDVARCMLHALDSHVMKQVEGNNPSLCFFTQV